MVFILLFICIVCINLFIQYAPVAFNAMALDASRSIGDAMVISTARITATRLDVETAIPARRLRCRHPPRSAMYLRDLRPKVSFLRSLHYTAAKEDACRLVISVMESWIVLGDRMSGIVVSKSVQKKYNTNNISL